MFIGSRVESEWRVEGESHSLTDAVCFDKHCVLAWQNYTAFREAAQPSESIMGLFKGAQRI